MAEGDFGGLQEFFAANNFANYGAEDWANKYRN